MFCHEFRTANHVWYGLVNNVLGHSAFPPGISLAEGELCLTKESSQFLKQNWDILRPRVVLMRNWEASKPRDTAWFNDRAVELKKYSPDILLDNSFNYVLGGLAVTDATEGKIRLTYYLNDDRAENLLVHVMFGPEESISVMEIATTLNRINGEESHCIATVAKRDESLRVSFVEQYRSKVDTIFDFQRNYQPPQ